MNNKIDKTPENAAAPSSVLLNLLTFHLEASRTVHTHARTHPPRPEDNIVQQTNEWSEAADERWVY